MRDLTDRAFAIVDQMRGGVRGMRRLLTAMTADFDEDDDDDEELETDLEEQLKLLDDRITETRHKVEAILLGRMRLRTVRGTMPAVKRRRAVFFSPAPGRRKRLSPTHKDVVDLTGADEEVSSTYFGASMSSTSSSGAEERVIRPRAPATPPRYWDMTFDKDDDEK